MLRGANLNDAANKVALSSKELAAAFNELRTAQPESFVAPANTAEIWHERQATFCEGDHNWGATVFHLAKILQLKPSDVDVGARLERVLRQAADKKE